MKTKTYILAVFFAVFLTACNKEKYLRIPAVETVSVYVEDNNVIVDGKVTDFGNAFKAYAGVYFAQGREPETAYENQILLDIASDGSFQAAIPDLKEDSTYYFGTFVATNLGYDLGDIIAFKIPRFSAPELPCASSLQKNYIKDENQNYAISNVSVEKKANNLYEYKAGLNAYGYSQYYTFAFYGEPKTGIYQTIYDIRSFDYIGRTGIVEVRVNKKVGMSFVTPPVNKMQEVYVDHTNPNKIIISFCGLKYSYQYWDYNIDAEVQGQVEFVR